MKKEKDPLHELELLIRSRYSVIFLETAEEDRVETLLRHLADHLRVPYFSWTHSKGLRREARETQNSIYGTSDFSNCLGHIEASKFPAIYHLKGAVHYFEDRVIASNLKDAASQYSKNSGAVMITGHDLTIPENLKPISALFRLPEPSLDQYWELLDHILRDLYSKMHIEFRMTPEDINRLLHNIKGLTLMEAEKILTKIIVEDGVLAPHDIRKVMEAKREIVEREGVLEYYPVEESMAQVADLKSLKSWLVKRKEIITDPERASEFGLPFPKGVLLLGVPGCGKSLCAKAVGMEWGLPVLKLDPSNLYNKYIGESERNFKRAMNTAEKLSPVVLWIDEIEKAFSSATGTEEGGISTRIFGTFLSWLQDRRGDVFIVATSNDVTKLPPEFMRKGRFDEIFFVDLPDLDSREAIFEIHLTKRNQNADLFDIPQLVEMTEGFSGSEIEQVIVSGLYTAFLDKTELSTQILLNEISLTRPLSVIMAERIEWLREWARDRTVSAH